jgi:universal stress protein A
MRIIKISTSPISSLLSEDFYLSACNYFLTLANVPKEINHYINTAKTMNDYQHILLAVDYSEHGDYVAVKARSLANKYQAKLSIIHVLDNIPMPDTNYGTVIPLNIDSSYVLLEAEKAKLMQLGDQMHVDSANRWLVWGVPKQEIIQIAGQEQVDLIVVGSHGRHGLALLLGSTANSILQYASCDVMAIRLQGG